MLTPCPDLNFRNLEFSVLRQHVRAWTAQPSLRLYSIRRHPPRLHEIGISLHDKLTGKIHSEDIWICLDAFYFLFCSFSVPAMPVICAFIVHCFQSRKMQPSSVAGIQFHVRWQILQLVTFLDKPLYTSSSKTWIRSSQEAAISAFLFLCLLFTKWWLI